MNSDRHSTEGNAPDNLPPAEVAAGRKDPADEQITTPIGLMGPPTAWRRPA